MRTGAYHGRQAVRWLQEKRCLTAKKESKPKAINAFKTRQNMVAPIYPNHWLKGKTVSQLQIKSQARLQGFFVVGKVKLIQVGRLMGYACLHLIEALENAGAEDFSLKIPAVQWPVEDGFI